MTPPDELPPSTLTPVSAPPRGYGADAVAEVSASFYRGPILPPELVASYKTILPGSEKKLLELALEDARHGIEQERLEADHRRKLETADQAEWARESAGGRRLSERAQVFAFGVVVVAALLGGYSLHCGYQYIAGAVFGVSLLGVVTAFLAQRPATPSAALPTVPPSQVLPVPPPAKSNKK